LAAHSGAEASRLSSTLIPASRPNPLASPCELRPLSPAAVPQASIKYVLGAVEGVPQVQEKAGIPVLSRYFCDVPDR